MDYFQTLPSDLLRQTALSLPPETIFKLSVDPRFDNIFTDEFWKEKLVIDFKQNYSSPPIKNSYLYTLINKINDEKRDLLRDARNKIPDILSSMLYRLDDNLEEFNEESTKFYNTMKEKNNLIEEIEKEMKKTNQKS